MLRALSVALFLLAHSVARAQDEQSCGAHLASTQKYVLIVDGYSSGNLIAPALRARGYEPIHLLSSKDIPADILASFKPNDFEPQHRFEWKDYLQLNHDLLAIRKDIAFVIPGSETGVPLADFLSEQFGLLTNGTELSEARRNKYLMAERLRSLGIEAVRQFLSSDLEDVLAQAPSLGKRVVIKPINSAGSDDVFFCDNEDEIRHAFETIMGKRNAYGLPNTSVLVQEYLDGPEYFVDTIALNGQLQFTDAAYYTKTHANGSPVVYTGISFAPYEEIERLGIVEYLKQVHRALAILNGPGHAEVKIVVRNGKKVPVLVEIGSRLAGGGVPVLTNKANGKSQLDYWLDMLLEPAKFAANLGKPYDFKHAEMVCLVSRKAGKLVAYPYLERIQKLKSFFRFRVRVNPGEELPLTTNFLNLPGHFELIHEDRAQIERDIAQIRAWELEPDFYKLVGE